jgi:hypothetical protein
MSDDVTDEDKIESRLQYLGLNAPRLSPDKIDAVIESVTYTVLPSGRTIICEMTLTNGYTVRGESTCVSAGNFNREIGENLSYKDARNKIWGLEAYLLTQRLYEAKACAITEDRS